MRSIAPWRYTILRQEQQLSVGQVVNFPDDAAQSAQHRTAEQVGNMPDETEPATQLDRESLDETQPVCNRRRPWRTAPLEQCDSKLDRIGFEEEAKSRHRHADTPAFIPLTLLCLQSRGPRVRRESDSRFSSALIERMDTTAVFSATLVPVIEYPLYTFCCICSNSASERVCSMRTFFICSRGRRSRSVVVGCYGFAVLEHTKPQCSA